MKKLFLLLLFCLPLYGQYSANEQRFEVAILPVGPGIVDAAFLKQDSVYVQFDYLPEQNPITVWETAFADTIKIIFENAPDLWDANLRATVAFTLANNVAFVENQRYQLKIRSYGGSGPGYPAWSPYMLSSLFFEIEEEVPINPPRVPANGGL